MSNKLFKRSFDGQEILDYNYHLILNKITSSFYKMERLRCIAEIRQLIKSYPNYKELIIESLTFDIEKYHDELNMKLSEPPLSKDIMFELLHRRLAGLNFILKWLKNDLTDYSENPKENSPVKKIEGYQSSLTDQQIQKLYDQLIKSHIDKNTNPEHFKAIFINEPLPQGCSIKWLKSNVLLAYFIKKLFHKDNFLNVWKTAQYIFRVNNLRQSENNPYPRGYENIDKILKPLQ